jgi:hypothetical protein
MRAVTIKIQAIENPEVTKPEDTKRCATFCFVGVGEALVIAVPLAPVVIAVLLADIVVGKMVVLLEAEMTMVDDPLTTVSSLADVDDPDVPVSMVVVVCSVSVVDGAIRDVEVDVTMSAVMV